MDVLTIGFTIASTFVMSGNLLIILIDNTY
jgi:hypothetical protein